MSEHVTYELPSQRRAVPLVLIAVGALVAGYGLYSDPARTWPSLLLNGFYFTSLSLSALFFLATQRATNARWSADALGLVLADLIVTHLLPAGSPLTVAVDDTLFKRSGNKVFGAAWHHDGAAKGPKPIGFGNCWVVAGIVVQLPFLSRPVCLPVLARLWRPRHTGKIAHAR